MSVLKEKPFGYLRRKANNEFFDENIVKSWYIARAYVLERMKAKRLCFRPDSNEHLHVWIDGDSAPMLFVARQVALSAHFINYHEDHRDETRRNRTVLSLVSLRPDIKKELEKEEYLCNLPKYCKYVDANQVCENADSYVDIEIHIVKDIPEEEDSNTLIFRQKDVEAFFEQAKDDDDVLSIDTRKAIYASRIYDLGAEIHNLPAEDIHCAKRYALALDIFQHEKLRIGLQEMVDDARWKELSLNKIKEKISNILCADCFSLRNDSVEICRKDKAQNTMGLWAEYNESLSKSEHARWVVEKLILGYRPLHEKERFDDESLQVQFKGKEKRKKYRDSLKRNDQDPAHIDLCSYRDLRRINPDDLKYDSFLMLAIPKILERVNENE